MNLAIIDISYADYNAGKAKSQVCAACHGSDGNSQVTMYPKLSGQYKDYLINSLNAYKSGSRKNAIMSPNTINMYLIVTFFTKVIITAV